jgi:hypothetical protein
MLALNRSTSAPRLGALVLLVAAGLVRPAGGQSMSLQVTGDHWRADSVSPAWGENVGAGLRMRSEGERALQGFVSVDMMPLHHGDGPLYFLLSAGGMFSPRGGKNGLSPYGGLTGTCILWDRSGYVGNNTGAATCGYALSAGMTLANSDTGHEPYLEVQYSIKNTMKRVSLVVGVYFN